MKNKRLLLLPATIATGFNLLAPNIHAAPISWDAGGANNSWSTVENWSDNAAATDDDVTFNATGALASGTTNTVDASISIASLTYNQESATLQHTTAIAAGQTLTVAGSFLLNGGVTTTTATNVTLSGATGTLTVGNSSNSTFQVGQISPNTTTGTTTNLLDMSGLGTFNANLGTSGTFRLGATNTNQTGALATVKLAATNTITTGLLGLGDRAGRGGVQTLKLGSVSNTINADTISLGSASGRGSGNLSFETSSGTLKLRAANGTSPVTAFNLINSVTGTTTAVSATADFSGHSIDAKIDALNMSKRTNATTTFASVSTATLTFDTGTLEVGTVDMANNAQPAVTAGSTAATINIGGGIASFNSIIMATSTAGGTSTTTAALNLTGGTTTLNGNISRGGGTNTTATLALNGASAILDMTGKNITSLTGITYTNGLLKNLGTVNTGMTLAGTGSRIFDQAAGISGTIQGAITGATLGLTKQGAGTLALSGTNTYGGLTQIDGGVLVFRNTSAKAAGAVTAGAAGSIGLGVGAVSGDYTHTDVATLFNTGTLGGFTLNAASSVAVDTTAGNYDQVTALTAARGLIKVGTNTLTLSQPNTYTGTTTLNAGAINLGVAEVVGVSGPLGTSAAANPGSIVFSGGTLQYSAANTHDYSGRFSTAANQSYNVSTNSQNVTWASDLISSGGTLTKFGAGSLTLTGDNTFTGSVTVSTGELKITKSGSLGTGPKTISIANNANLTLDGTAANINLASNLSIRATGPSILNNAGDNVINGTITTVTGNGTATVTSNGGSLELAGNIDSAGTGNRVLQLAGTSTGANTVSGAVSNGTSTFAITKSGTGTWILDNDGNAYTGATNVTGGKLVVNGNISTSSLTSIAIGATLAGSGTVGKTVVNGTLAVGNSPGQMDFTDTLSLVGSTIMEIDGTAGAGVTGGHDFVNLTGSGGAGVLTYGGAMTLDLGVIFGEGTYSWNLFDMASETGTFATIALADQYSGSLLDADLNGVWDLTSGVNTWQFTESTGVLGLTVIPEPSPAALLGGVAVLALLRRRR